MDVTPYLRIYRPSESDEAADASAAGNSHPVDPTCGARDSQCHPVSDAQSASSGAHITAGLWSGLTPITGVLLALVLLSGCTAFRPLKGIPVSSLPWELRGQSRANMETIDLLRLGQTPLPAHIVDSGDILAIYVKGFLGPVDEVPPVYIPQNADNSNAALGYPIPVRHDGTISLPEIQPLNVRGLTVSQVEDLVRKTYTTDKQILERGRESILVSLQKARTHKITVLRQETANSPISVAAGGSLQLGTAKKGTGQLVTLQAGENDVLHALTVTGGLPGLDAQNAIYVLRRARMPAFPRSFAAFENPVKRTQTPIQLTSGTVSPYGGRYGNAFQAGAMGGQPQWGHSVPQPDPNQAIDLEGTGDQRDPATNIGFQQGYSQPVPQRQQWEAMPIPAPYSGGEDMNPGNAMPAGPMPSGPMPASPAYVPPQLQPFMTGGAQVVRIPIRLHPGEQAQFTEQDVLLFDGDVVFIESCETEIFYTGGLLGGGQYQLPREYDLNVLDAISLAQGRQASGGGGGGFGNRIGGIAAVNQDISVSASTLIIIRRLPDGNRINIKVDLNRVLRDQNEDILIQAGDHLILRYKPLEAVGAFIERNILAGSLFGLAAAQAQGNK